MSGVSFHYSPPLYQLSYHGLAENRGYLTVDVGLHSFMAAMAFYEWSGQQVVSRSPADIIMCGRQSQNSLASELLSIYWLYGFDFLIYRYFWKCFKLLQK